MMVGQSYITAVTNAMMVGQSYTTAVTNAMMVGHPTPQLSLTP